MKKDILDSYMKKLKLWTGIGMMLTLLLCGCQEDDINEIFTSDTWHWSASYDTSDWDNDNEFTPTLTRQNILDISKNKNNYIIRFNNDGTLEGQGQSFSFTGRWSANPEDRSVSIRLDVDRTPNGVLDRTFYGELTSAQFYRGDSRMLKLFNSNKNHFIQLTPIYFYTDGTE